jgi:hypothetical protein
MYKIKYNELFILWESAAFWVLLHVFLNKLIQNTRPVNAIA